MVRSVSTVTGGKELTQQLEDASILLAQAQGRYAAEVEEGYAMIRVLHTALHHAQELSKTAFLAQNDSHQRMDMYKAAMAAVEGQRQKLRMVRLGV